MDFEEIIKKFTEQAKPDFKATIKTALSKCSDELKRKIWNDILSWMYTVWILGHKKVGGTQCFEIFMIICIF